MSNYATYSDIEKRKFSTTGQTFSAAQQSAITAIITNAHGIITGYLRSEPASNDNLKDIEIELTMRMLCNAENFDKGQIEILTKNLMNRLDKEKEGSSSDDSSTLSVVGSAYKS